jgi:hypothetical protein
MPHVVQLDLSNVSSHGRAPAVGGRHWLLRAVYGRDLLKAKLRQVRPDLVVKRWAEQRELDSLLDDMVDEMNLRDWPEPVTAAARLRYLSLVLRMLVAVDEGAPLPTWR